MTASTLTRLSCVLFDLDGTLVDSAPGITECLADTIRHSGGPSMTSETLRRYVGPPIDETLLALTSLPRADLPMAISHYRSAYLERGIHNSVVFPGIHALLTMLRECGVTLAVATSKREDHALAMLKMHSLDTYFAVVSGANIDDSGASKPAVIAAALAQLAGDAKAPLMIGDRSFDMAGARAMNIPALYAEWGYGTPEESEGAALSARDPHHASALLHDYCAPSARQRNGAS
ncbi:HAD hydrolase-like protein [Microcella sp.]|uniref:HAD hydrolase-like protein n=1 Tax=Microcella sp. TaxID=1913979 RepID=UPI00255E1AC1|nr:HAD hydrolase-like protein [Microcella sp.]MBX9471683.1 HAD hydrolase-like protein [Microcella sp.]